MRYQVVNFTVTLSGLSEQLLETIVRLERPEIEEKRVHFIKAMARDQLHIDKIQEEILTKIVNTREKAILDDQDLIAFLGKSSSMSLGITQAMEEN